MMDYLNISLPEFDPVLVFLRLFALKATTAVHQLISRAADKPGSTPSMRTFAGDILWLL